MIYGRIGSTPSGWPCEPKLIASAHRVACGPQRKLGPRCSPGASRLKAHRSRIFQVLSRNSDRYPATASGNPTSASFNPGYGDRDPGIDGLYPTIPADYPGMNTRIPRKSPVEGAEIVKKGSFSRIIPCYQVSRSLLSGLKFPVPIGAFCLNDVVISSFFSVS